MCTVNEGLKFADAVWYIFGDVGVDVVVVFYSVWTASFAFYHVYIVRLDAWICGGLGMLYHSGVPNVCDAEWLDRLQYFGIDVIHFAHSVLGDGAIRDAVIAGVGEESRE